MSTLIKGFISVSENISNTPTKVEPLGELPTFCITYGKEIGLYNNGFKPNINLYTLYSKNSDNEDVELDKNIQEEIFFVYDKIKEYCDNNIKPLNKNNLLKAVRASLILKANNISVGAFVSNDRNEELPAWISWESINYDYKCKVWLSGDVLLYDYDEFYIEVIPPVENMDVFFEGSSAVEAAMKQRSINTLMEMAQEAKDLYPETYTSVLTYEYLDTNSGKKIDVSWVVLIYGVAGNTTDNIKDAITEHCLKNSTHSRAEWISIFKELFSKTEFVIIPRYDIYSIPTLYTETGMYGSIVNPKECIEYCQSKIDYYPQEHIASNTRILPYDYKGIMMCFIPSDTNIEGYKNLEEIYPDYIPVSSTSTDFMRMSENTRNWCLKLEEMLKNCEYLDEYSDIPRGYRRVRRDNKIYLSITIGKVYYLMLSAKY